MAIGDEAAAAGYSIVPGTGEEGRVRWGYREINRTRDYIAQLKTTVNGLVAKPKTAAGNTSLSFNASGAVIFVHNLGWTPKYMSFIPRLNQAAFLITVSPVAGSVTTTNVTLVGFTSAGVRSGATSLSAVDWFAHQ